MGEVFQNHRWRDPSGVVHHVEGGGQTAPTIEWKDHMFKARVARSEAHTPCGIRMGSDYFVYSVDAPTCLWCVTGGFVGWRTPSWPS